MNWRIDDCVNTNVQVDLKTGEENYTLKFSISQSNIESNSFCIPTKNISIHFNCKIVNPTIVKF